LVVATSNFETSIDEAFFSRTDFTHTIPLPDQAGRQAILVVTLRAVAAAYPGVGSLLEPQSIERLAVAAEGLDARRLRKSVAVACALDASTADDPGRLTESQLLAGIEATKARR